MRRIINGSWLRTVIAAAIAAAAVAGIAQAAIPSTSDGLISGCYDKTGKLRVIDAQAGAKCAGGEKPLAWNQQGPAGPSGPSGPQGEPGGLAGYQVVGKASELSASDIRTVTAFCPQGTRPIGGGGSTAGNTSSRPPVAITQSEPFFHDELRGWQVSARELEPISDPNGWMLSADAICASVG